MPRVLDYPQLTKEEISGEEFLLLDSENGTKSAKASEFIEAVKKNIEEEGGAYHKPATGIPEEDLSEEVREKLIPKETSEEMQNYIIGLLNQTAQKVPAGYYWGTTVDGSTWLPMAGGGTDTPVASPDESYVLIESFGGGTDKSASENDNAFKLALRTGKPIKFSVPNGEYNFSGNVIDPKDPTPYTKYGRRIEIDFNYAKIHNLCFRWNMKSDGEPYVTSAVGFCYLTLKNAWFTGNQNRPVVLSATPIRLINCNYSTMKAVVGYTARYVDYFYAEEGQCYDVERFLVTVDYDGNIIDNGGCYGDWFSFKRVHFSFNTTRNTIVYMPNTDHPTTLYFEQCLHGVYPVKHGAYQRNKYIFKACHHELGSELQNLNTERAMLGDIYMEDCYMYSTFLPDDLTGIEMKNCRINYGNHQNYKDNAVYRGSFIKEFAEIFLRFNEQEFFTNVMRSTTPYYRTGNNYTIDFLNSNSYRKWTEEKSVKYYIASSLMPDRLWFNGETPTGTWSNAVTTVAGKNMQITVGSTKDKLTNVFLHIFRQMDGKTQRAVIPISELKSSNLSYNNDGSNPTLSIYDEITGVLGYPFVDYSGTVGYVAN